MKIKETGFILFLENYTENIDFYISVLGLSIREQQEQFTIFNFGNSYLMVENNGVGATKEKSRMQNPTVIRIDIEDFNRTIEELEERDISVKVHRYEWGTIGVIVDPEGNRIEIKEA
jgi:lactoylglutathione lyase